MGSCFSASIQSANHPYKGVNSTHDGKQEDGSISGGNEVLQLKVFTYNELKAATRKFHADNIVSKGESGNVIFKGWLDEHTLAPSEPHTGIAVAVKKLKKDGSKDEKEWMTEINILGQLHHPNIVKLIGYCLENDHQLLVYEFLPKRSLDNHLFRAQGEPLSWKTRMKIALGVAKALAFLHSDEVNVMHRNLSISAILLDTNFNAKLYDFDLARTGPFYDESHVETRFMGTCDYAVPEYITKGGMTKKSNVYTFGAILLEIMSGRPALDRNRPKLEERNLVKWAKPYLLSNRLISQVMDARIEGEYPVHEVKKVAKIVMQCVTDDPNLRPTMDDVLSAMEQLMHSSDEGSSRTYNCGVSN